METTLMVWGFNSGSVRQQIPTSSGHYPRLLLRLSLPLPGPQRAKNVAWTSQTETLQTVTGFKSGIVSSVSQPLFFVSSLTPVTQGQRQSKYVSLIIVSAVRD